jgi:branched chain amino acid aminotransferase apoenzyme (EC 2.6.1.42)
VSRDRSTSDSPSYAHVDNELVPMEDATVSIRDRGFMYGDGVFETLRAYGGEVFRWKAHANRLADSASAINLEHGLSQATLKNRIDETLTANNLDEAYVKLSITRGVQPGKLNPDPTVDPTVVVQTSPLPRGGINSNPVWDGPATLQTVKTRRIPDRALPSHAKTHNYLNGILARAELRVSDADEAVMLDTDGQLAEGATGNIFFVDGDALCTPSLDGPVLPGITRSTVLDIAAEEGIPIREDSFDINTLREAEEAFVTNTTWEIRPVKTIDGIDIGRGPLTTLLQQAFQNRVEKRYYDTHREVPNEE